MWAIAKAVVDYLFGTEGSGQPSESSHSSSSKRRIENTPDGQDDSPEKNSSSEWDAGVEVERKLKLCDLLSAEQNENYVLPMLPKKDDSSSKHRSTSTVSNTKIELNQGERVHVNEITAKETSLECSKTELSKFQEQKYSLSVELKKQTQITNAKNDNVKQLQEKKKNLLEMLVQVKQDENKTKDNLEQAKNKETQIKEKLQELTGQQYRRNNSQTSASHELSHVTTDSPEMRETQDRIRSGEKERFDYMDRKHRLEDKKRSLEKEKTAVEKEISLHRTRLKEIKKKRLHYEQERDQVSTCLVEAKKQLDKCLKKRKKLEKQIATCAQNVSNQEKVIKDQTDDLLQTYRKEKKQLDSQIAEFPVWHLNEHGYSFQECIERYELSSCLNQLNDLKENKRSCKERIAELKLEM